MDKKYTPGLIPWIALVFLLVYMTRTMVAIVDHITFMELRILELEVEVIEEDSPEYYEGWDGMNEEEKANRLRIALTTT